MRNRSSTTTTFVLTAIAVTLAAGGCRAEKSATQPTSPVPLASNSARSVEPEQDAISAYRGMWAAFVEAGKTADPDAPDLRKYATDEALKRIVSALFTNREHKQVLRGDLVIDPKVTATYASQVTILDCVNDEKWLVYNASGGLYNNVPGGRHKTTATVKPADGAWKVSTFALEKAGTC